MGTGLRRVILELVRERFGKSEEPKGELEEGKQDPNEHTVEWLQASLNELGAAPPLTVDGVYGEATARAVHDYQKAHPPLAVDGIAGSETQESIETELNT